MKINDIEIYTLPTCPFCLKAKALLKELKLDFNEYDISHDEENLREKLAEKFKLASPATLPQISVNGHYIGGYTDLKKLVNANELQSYLN